MPLGCEQNQIRKQLMTDKHIAEHLNNVCLGIDWPVCVVDIAHTVI